MSLLPLVLQEVPVSMSLLHLFLQAVPLSIMYVSVTSMSLYNSFCRRYLCLCLFTSHFAGGTSMSLLHLISQEIPLSMSLLQLISQEASLSPDISFRSRKCPFPVRHFAGSPPTRRHGPPEIFLYARPARCGQFDCWLYLLRIAN